MNALTDALPPLPKVGDSVASGGAPSVGRIVLGTLTGGVSEIPAIIGKATGTNFSLQSIVAIILGLLFVAAGIFAFREVRTTVISTGKTAAKVAAL